jgi:hypothetical protein
MFLLHSVQRDEETLVIDCQQYCLENLVTRLYDLDSASTEHGLPNGADLGRPPAIPHP